MRVFLEDGFLIGLRDTGCQQTFLGLRIEVGQSDDLPIVIRWNGREGVKDGPDNDVAIAQLVNIAVQDFDSDFDTKFKITHLKYDPADPFDAVSYQTMIARMLRWQRENNDKAHPSD